MPDSRQAPERAAHRRPWLAILLATALYGCGMDAPDRPARLRLPDRLPERVVSLDYCADQYVLRFVDRDRILAVSPDADADFSYMREHAAGLRAVRPVAEDVMILKPDLVVRSYGGGPNAPAMFERAGIAVHTIGWAEDIEGVMRAVGETARALGAAERGAAVVADMRTRLAALADVAPGTEALYMTPSGVTSGPGSLVDEMFQAAGLDNFQTEPGWRPIPLERLVYEQPDLIVPAFFDSLTDHPEAWSPMRHPVARTRLQSDIPLIPIEGAWTACGAWFLVDAVEALARGAAR